MRLRRLGRTGLQVSEIGFGALEIGRAWGVAARDRQPPDETASLQLLETVCALGINFVDTAAAYVLSEERLGKALRFGLLRRNAVYLATKAGERFDATAGSRYDYSYAGITSSIMESLERLQVDRVEGAQLHSAPLEVVRSGDAIRALRDLRNAGRCEFVGASFSDAQACAEAVQSGDYDTIQITYNLLEHSQAERLLVLAREADVGVIVKSPLAKGLLSARDALLSPEEQGRIAPYRFLERDGQTLTQAAFRFALSHPAVSTVLSGTKHPEHLRANVGAADGCGLRPEELARLRAIPDVSRP
jgi:aryl-alcohol dehydrogenase-like predicted oxidoreductase